MAAQHKEINLLPKEKWEQGVLGKILKWALNVGRYVVVFTELIVISAFLYRFGLDKKLTDLNEEIERKKIIVNSYGDLEEKYRRLQSQLQLVSNKEKERVTATTILTVISQITPIDTSYTNIVVEKEKVSLEGETLSEVGLATLLAKAQAQSIFDNATLDSVTSANEKSASIGFRLSLELAK